MRYGPDDKFWIVTDPTPRSELADVLFENSLRKLAQQFLGGMPIDENPTMFADGDEARREAEKRLAVMRRARSSS